MAGPFVACWDYPNGVAVWVPGPGGWTPIGDPTTGPQCWQGGDMSLSQFQAATRSYTDDFRAGVFRDTMLVSGVNKGCCCGSGGGNANGETNSAAVSAEIGGAQAGVSLIGIPWWVLAIVLLFLLRKYKKA